MRVDDPSIPRCNTCRRPLRLEEAVERDCQDCKARVLYQDEAYEAGQHLGLWLRWQEVRDYGLLEAIKCASERRRGEWLLEGEDW